MLGIVLLYFIAKSFNQLAKSFEKRNSWVFALAGIAVYYASTFIGKILLELVLLVFSLGTLENLTTLQAGFVGLPFGVLGVVGFYFLLKRIWARQSADQFDEVIDARLDV